MADSDVLMRMAARRPSWSWRRRSFRSGHSLLVSKKATPEAFYLSGAKPEAGESAEQTLIRELGEELGVIPTGLMLLGDVEEVAAIDNVPMRMTVFTARIAQGLRSAA